MDEAKRVVDRIKLSGSFDRYRQEIFNKLAESNEMKDCVESCSTMADDTIQRASESADIKKLREMLRGKLHARNFAKTELFKMSDNLLDQLTQSTQFNELVNSMVRQELRMATPEAGRRSESASDDMEVSSGATSNTHSNTVTSSSSRNNSPLAMAMSVSQSSPSSLHSSVPSTTPSTPVDCNGIDSVVTGGEVSTRLNNSCITADNNDHGTFGSFNIDHTALSPVSSDSPPTPQEDN